MPDKLDLLREAIWKQMEHHTKELAALQSKLKKIEEVNAMAKELVQSQVDLQKDQVQPKRYATLGLTEATRDALKLIARDKAKTLSEIRQFLAENGLQVPAKNFTENLNGVLGRLEEKKEITVERKDGQKRTFLWNHLVDMKAN